MKQIKVAFVVAFAAIAVLGVFAMNHGGGHDFGCLAATAQGAVCPGNAMAFINFHFGAFQNLSSAILNTIIGLLAIFAAFLPGGALVNQLTPAPSASPRPLARRRSFRSGYKQTHWLALHRNSPDSL